MDNSFAFKIPVGVDFFITDSLAISIEAKYFYTDPNVDIKVDAENSDNVRQDTFTFGGGLKYFFKSRRSGL